MLALLVLVLVNLAFLNWGDILILYALLGMSLLLFRRSSDRDVLNLGLVIVPPLILGFLEWAIGGPAPNLAGIPPGQAESMMAVSAPIYRSGAYASFVSTNLRS